MANTGKTLGRSKKSTKQHFESIAQSRALIAASDAAFITPMETDQSMALIPISGVHTIRETVHNGVIIDADPTATQPLNLTDDSIIQTADHVVIVDAEIIMENVAQSSVGYVRNARRAVYARYLVKMAITLLDLVKRGTKTYPDGSPILPRVADVATFVLNLHRKTGDLPHDLDLPLMRAMLADVRDPAHHAKCLIAAGLFNSHDLPQSILWDSARAIPFYALPNSPDMPFLSLIYGDAMGHGGAFNHQLASDFLARLTPSYVTPALYQYCFTLNNMSYTALHKFLRSFLDDSRLNTPINLCYDRARDAANLVLAAPRGMKTPGYLEKLH